MSQDLTLAMRLYADASRFIGGLRQGTRGMESFVSQGKRQINDLKGHLGSLNGMLAGLGLGVGMGAMIKQAAELDKSLVDLRNSSNSSAAAVRALRADMLDTAIATGVNVDVLNQGVATLIAGGLSISQARGALMPFAETLAVFPTQAEELAKALGVTAQQFDVDLTSMKEARQLLDEFAVSATLANAELKDLPSIMSSVAGTAKQAGFSRQQTLALVETVSLSQPDASINATVSKNTMNMFTKLPYMKQVGKATGIKFFDGEDRRDPITILAELKKQYDSLPGESSKSNWFGKAFGGFDDNTIEGMRTILNDKNFSQLGVHMERVNKAAGEVSGKLPTAIDTAIARTNQLQAHLRKAGDAFARPILDAYSKAVGMVVDPVEKGGLTGKEMAIGAGTIAGGAVIMKIMGGWLGDLLRRRPGAGAGGPGGALGNLLSGAPALAGGIAMGKAIESLGVQPVFVVNMPDGGVAGSLATAADAAGDLLGGGGKRFSKLRTGLALLRGAPLGAIPGMGAGAMASAGLAVAGAGALGYGLGTLLYDNLLAGTTFSDKLGEGIARALAPFSDNARDAINQRVSGKLDLNIKVDSEGRATVSPSGPVMLEPPTRTNPAATGRMLWGG